MAQGPRPIIGLALGSGSARGLAHMGILDELDKLGVQPDIICGSSVGSLVGAASVLGKTSELIDWVKELSTGDILHYMDIRLAAGGGFAHGQKLMSHLSESFGNPSIEELKPRFAAVATDLGSGREIWLQEGPIWDAVRASIALPGMLTPVAHEQHWLVDGGLVNPVPVSVCRALGAEVILAVNLNGSLLGRRIPAVELQSPNQNSDDANSRHGSAEQAEADFLARVSSSIKERAQPLLEQWLNRDDSGSNNIPGIFDVIAGSINIMQDRITRSRLAGEPADIVFSPRLAGVGLLEFERADECITEGRACVQRHRKEIQDVTGILAQPLEPASNTEPESQ